MADTEVHIDPWCLVTSADGSESLLGYVTMHPNTGGLSWVRTSPVVDLDRDLGRAKTESGRHYRLGKALELVDLPLKSEEGWVAYLCLYTSEGPLLPDDDTSLETARRWLMAQKAARWLDIPPPRREAMETEAWWQKHRKTYLAKRNAFAGRSGVGL